MKRLKLWFHNTVLAEVHKIMDRIICEYQRVIEAHIVAVVDRERRALAVIVETAKGDLKAAADDLHTASLAKAVEKMESELSAFEAKVQHTLEACIKDEPAHWRADDETKKSDKLHQQPQR